MTHQAIARIELGRPEKLNALSLGVLAGIIEQCAAIGRDPDVRVVVLSGEGRAFCAGFDLADFAGAGDDGARLGLAAVEAIERIPVMTIAAVHGHCIGGGFLLALACDLRVATTDTRFAIPEIDLGIPLGWGGVPRLVREIGPARTKELVATGRPFTAAEADQWGMLNAVVEPGALDAHVDALAATIAAKPRLGTMLTKQQARIAADAMVSGYDARGDRTLLRSAAADAESRAAARAYLDGRMRG